ncbi:metallophosphoesterase [Hyalangium rubrum]|uniref:Metallophosphoesterase n=1 Tax=Hyalangium rubrum TaxID=3103134 RepID=A0ABU5HHM8_9BACT|nr:metallophosphoesterase [Hyalangium sp. s54d21]MDY7232332.1 metallophosphoesterase [Hyalangium sp. s54d21]
MTSPRIQAALDNAARCAAGAPHSEPAQTPPVPRTRRVAIGDPQADLGRFLAILDRHGLLGANGWLLPHVQLVSVGDHFDWGGREEREAVARSCLRLVAWLAAHPADQAIILAGNHDLGRVGEMAEFTDATFAQAQAEADRVYSGDDTDEAQEHAFLERYPHVPTVELVSRDFGNFREEQRAWVTHLLRQRRLRVAYAAGPSLLVLHAGVTREDLREVGVAEGSQGDAPTVAAALNGALDAAVEAWKGGRLVIPKLHHPGSAASSEGVGIFYQRPSLSPEEAELTRRTPRRRFDPRRLPLGLTQVVGHTKDKRTRQLLRLPGEVREGMLRHLLTDGAQVSYAHGAPARTGPGEAVLVFTDGGMREAPVEAYELFDLDARAAAPPG